MSATSNEPPRSAPCAASMRNRVDAFDWSATPLGPRSHWPVELEIAVQQMLDSSFPKAVVWGPELTTIYNDAFLPMLGAKPDTLGCSFAKIWSEAWDTIGPIANRAYSGLPTYIEDFPLTTDRSGVEEKAWFTFCYSPLRLADGSIAGMLDTVIETTDKVRAQADLALVNQELGHRLKNTLTLVQAIASQTLRDAVEPEAMEKFLGRIRALGHAHDILLHQDWATVPLSQVVSASVKPHDALGQIRIAGAAIQISAHAAVALSLMLHELATNAMKYGALSNPDGWIDLSWSVEADHLNLRWREAGGPAISKPTRTGFGSRLIEMGLGGQTKLQRTFDTDGFKLDVEVPLSELAR